MEEDLQVQWTEAFGARIVCRVLFRFEFVLGSQIFASGNRGDGG